MSMDVDLPGSGAHEDWAMIDRYTGDLAMFGEMLADYGAERLRRIVRDGFAVLEKQLSLLRRVAAGGSSKADDAEECARLLQFLRITASDAGLRSFAEACRFHERRARRGVALARAEAETLTERCRAARDRMDRLLSAPALESLQH